MLESLTNPRDWVRGCASPVYPMRKHRNLMFSVLFASLSSLTYGRGAVGYTIGVTRKPGVNDKATVNTPDRQFLDGQFFIKEAK